MAEEADLIETILGVEPGSALPALRARRPEFVARTAGYHDALMFSGSAAGTGLSPAERALIALTVAERAGHAGLAAHYATLATDAEAADTPRRTAILDHVRRVAERPGSATPAHLAALRVAGLATADIVTLTQIVAFVSYQLRVVTGLALLAHEPAR